MFLTVTIAVVLGFLVIIAMKRVPSPLSRQLRESGFHDGREPLAENLSLNRFEWLCRSLLRATGLDIEHTTTAGTSQVEIAAVNPAPIIGGQYLVHGELLATGEVIEAVQVLALLDAVKGEGASKGVFITNGFFSDEAHQAAVGGPIELINGARFEELLQQYEVGPLLTKEVNP
jgi:restriction endonuclease Mrr